MTAADVRFAQPREPTTHVSERLVLTRRFIAPSDASTFPIHNSVVDQLPSMPCLRSKGQDHNHGRIHWPLNTYQPSPINVLGSAPA